MTLVPGPASLAGPWWKPPAVCAGNAGLLRCWLGGFCTCYMRVSPTKAQGTCGGEASSCPLACFAVFGDIWKAIPGCQGDRAHFLRVSLLIGELISRKPWSSSSQVSLLRPCLKIADVVVASLSATGPSNSSRVVRFSRSILMMREL